jgi:hypothetical protein
VQLQASSFLTSSRGRNQRNGHEDGDAAQDPRALLLQNLHSVIHNQPRKHNEAEKFTLRGIRSNHNAPQQSFFCACFVRNERFMLLPIQWLIAAFVFARLHK